MFKTIIKSSLKAIYAIFNIKLTDEIPVSKIQSRYVNKKNKQQTSSQKDQLLDFKLSNQYKTAGKADGDKTSYTASSQLMIKNFTPQYSQPIAINAQKLCKQIDCYVDDFDKDNNNKTAFDYLNKQGEQLLYGNNTSYQIKHRREVANFKAHHPFEFPVFEPSCDSKYFREAFVYYMENRLKKGDEGIVGYKPGFNDIRADSPTQATTQLKTLLGPLGYKLFQLALDEEMHSDAYKKAVFNKSSVTFQGPSWKYRPVIYIGGPSACGKTFSTKAAIKNASELFEKETNGHDNTTGNFVTASDGGVVRELSQIRNLVIEAAIAKGYTGISDLQSKTNAKLNQIKNDVKKAALASETLGVAIPETFSDPRVRLGLKSKLRSYEKRREHGKQNRTVFVMVEGQDEMFQDVVNYMGDSRALKRDWAQANKINFDLNRQGIKLPESKIYQPQYFENGLKGSRAALKVFKSSSKDRFSIIAKNDLVLKCPLVAGDPNSVWVDAKFDSPGVVLVSLRVFNRYKMLGELIKQGHNIEIKQSNMKEGQRPPSNDEIINCSSNLEAFMTLSHQINNDNPVKVGGEILFGSPFLPPVIKTSAEIKMAIALDKFNDYLKVKSSTANSQVRCKLGQLVEELNTIRDNPPPGYHHYSNCNNKQQITQLTNTVKSLYDSMKEQDGFISRNLFKRKEYRTIKFLIQALDDSLTIIDYKEKGKPDCELHSPLKTKEISTKYDLALNQDITEVAALNVRN